MMDIFSEPDFEGFDGLYVGVPEEEILPGKYDLKGIMDYAKEKRIPYDKLTREEMDMFKIE